MLTAVRVEGRPSVVVTEGEGGGVRSCYEFGDYFSFGGGEEGVVEDRVEGEVSGVEVALGRDVGGGVEEGDYYADWDGASAFWVGEDYLEG